MTDNIFKMRVKTQPWWMWMLARIFGKTIKSGGFVFKSWRNRLWVVREDR